MTIKIETDDEYHGGPGVSKTTLWTLHSKTPFHARYGARKESPAFDLGKAEEERAEKNRLNEARASRHGKVALTDKINARIEAMKGVPNADMAVKDIIEMVAANHDLTYSHIISDLKFRHIVAARYEAMRTVSRLLPGMSSTRIAEFFNRDHTTVLYALGRTARGKRYGYHE